MAKQLTTAEMVLAVLAGGDSSANLGVTIDSGETLKSSAKSG